MWQSSSLIVAVLIQYLTVYSRWSTGGLLIFAGLLKVRDMDQFISTVESFQVVPGSRSRYVSWIVVLLEVATGTALFLGAGARIAAIAASALLFVFSIVISINLVRKNLLNCNCFGPYFSERISVRAILRNITLILPCIFILRFYDGYLALDFWLVGDGAGKNFGSVEFALVTAGLIVVALVIYSVRTIGLNARLVRRGY